MDAADAQGLGAVAEPQGDPSDTLSTVLEAVHLTGAVFFLVEGAAPWVAEAPASTQLAPVILQDAQHRFVSRDHSGVVLVRIAGPDAVAARDGRRARGAARARVSIGECVRSPHRWSLDETLDWFRAMAGGRLPFVVTEGGGGLMLDGLVCAAAMHCRSTRCWRHYRRWVSPW